MTCPLDDNKCENIALGAYLLFINSGAMKYMHTQNTKCLKENNSIEKSENCTLLSSCKKVCPYNNNCVYSNLNLGFSFGIVTGLCYLYKGYKGFKN